MIVVVAAEESFPDLRAALPDRPVEHAPTVAAATPLPERASLVVVDATTVDGARELVAEVRTGTRLPPALVVVLPPDQEPTADLLPVDQTVWAPFDENTLRDAVRRGLLAAEYHRAVGDLFDACSARAAGGTTDPLEESETLREARRSADEILDEAADEPGLLAAILQCSADE